MSIDVMVKCKHCGDPCTTESHTIEQHSFCCNGCLMVYQILDDNNLTDYYKFENHPGISLKQKNASHLDFLDDDSVIEKLLAFNENGIARVKLKLPQIHCSACLYLLENISKLNESIFFAKVDFLKKEATFQFHTETLSLKGLVQLLVNIGYEPILQFDQLEEKSSVNIDRSLIYKIGLAGFAFGNIMLLSFPEYLGFHEARSAFYLGYINTALIIPVLLYSASDYFKSAFISLKHGQLNLDFPIILGMSTLFLRSVYEILFQVGEGYLDSLSGFIFFLLIGKWFQSFTYKQLDFDRTYKSYFPISSTLKTAGQWLSISIDKINIGDTLLIRNLELIPVDCELVKGHARIDYSFVTGESDLLSKVKGDSLLAGGRQVGESLEVLVQKKVDQSQLTQLWNEKVFKDQQSSSSSLLIDRISKYFTISILLLALLTFAIWLMIDTSRAFTVFTSVLIVACPCALALAIPFTYGNILRFLSKAGFHIRNIQAIERIQDVEHTVFDKTGTITDSQRMTVLFDGENLSNQELILIKSSCIHSNHPLSKAIVDKYKKVLTAEVESFNETVGSGLVTHYQGSTLKLGSDAFIFNLDKSVKSGVFVEIDGIYKGCFEIKHNLRNNIKEVIGSLHQQFGLSLLSGDSNNEASRMQKLFGSDISLTFNASPDDKLNYIRSLQRDDVKVMMIGDGLNDAGALKQSDIGIVISDDVNNFSPACDAIIQADVFSKFDQFIGFIKAARKIVYGAFFLAFLYNVIGLAFAITGNLSPVVAAILMPLSSITVIIYGLSVSLIVFRLKVKSI